MNKSSISISIAIVLVVFLLSTSFLQAQRKALPRTTENKNATVVPKFPIRASLISYRG
jgi:hypothetical protein